MTEDEINAELDGMLKQVRGINAMLRANSDILDDTIAQVRAANAALKEIELRHAAQRTRKKMRFAAKIKSKLKK